MTIRVHHELSEPSNAIRVWMIPRIKTPNKVPATKPTPPLSRVPPISNRSTARTLRLEPGDRR